MPITRCPICDQEFPSDKGNNRNEGGLFILPIEPFSTDAGGSAPAGGGGSAAGEAEDGGDDRGGREVDQQQQQQQQNSQHSRWVRGAPCHADDLVCVGVCVRLDAVGGCLGCPG